MPLEIKFGVDGWRDVIADGFTFSNVRIVTKAIASYISKTKDGSKELPVLIGYDSRFLAKEFAITSCNELTNSGFQVLVSENIVPTPVIAYYAAKLKTNGAIQFTASHNPPIYCGLKYITNYGGPAPVEVTDEITGYIRNQTRDQRPELPALSSFNPKKEYFSHIKNLIAFDVIKKAKLKVVYDPLYGAGLNYLDYLLNEAGCKTTIIHNKRDPLFGGLLPEPKEEFLYDLKQSVLVNQANIGLATDGDADRLSAIDEKGIFYSPNKIASMLLRHLVKNKKLKGAVVRTLSTTHLLDRLAKKYDLDLIETKIGFKWICEEMRTKNVLIGAEESGGISILNHIPDKDGILAGMLIIEMLAFEKKSLEQIYKDTLNEACWSPVNDRMDLHLDKQQIDNLISILKTNETKELVSKDLKIKSINIKEGVKYIFEDGSWFMIRASGTEPMARIYFEATSDKVLKTMKELINKICQK